MMPNDPLPPFQKPEMPRPPSSDPSRGSKLLLAFLLTGLISLLTTSAGVSAYLYFRWQDQQQVDRSIVDQAEAFQSEGNPEACIAEAKKVPKDSSLVHQAEALIADCQNELVQRLIRQARTLAANGELKAAIALLQEISSPSHNGLAQRLTEEWSFGILQTAERYYRDPTVNRLAEAINVASAITPDCPIVFQMAQNRMAQWRSEWASHEASVQAAKTALEVDDLETAQSELSKLTVPYWRNQAQPLIRQAASRQEALYANLWAQALELMEQGQLERVFWTADKLPDTAIWRDRKAELLRRARDLQRRDAVLMEIAFISIAGLCLRLLRR